VDLHDLTRLLDVAAGLVELGDLAPQLARGGAVPRPFQRRDQRLAQRQVFRVLRQRGLQQLHRVGVRAGLDLRPGQRVERLAAVGERAPHLLGDAQHQVDAGLPAHLLEQRGVLPPRLVLHLLAHEQVGEVQPVRDVGGVERGDPAQQVERLALQLLLLADLEGFLELAQRVRGQAHALEALAEVRARLE